MSPGSVNLIMRRVIKIISLSCLPLFALVTGWLPAAAEETVADTHCRRNSHHRRA